MTAHIATLVSFNQTNGEVPLGKVVVDDAGDLFSTTSRGGEYSDGMVFEIAKTSAGYASTPTVLASFDGANGAYPHAGLVSVAAGDLFGTTFWDGSMNGGGVFEIAKTSTGYASAPTTVANFGNPNGFPSMALFADADGDLFGSVSGEVFEIAKTSAGYASAPTIVAGFDGSNGTNPTSVLVADLAGDLFGMSFGGGTNSDGAVFEIPKTSDGYASTPTLLASLNGADGKIPQGGLVLDGAGNLIGTAAFGGTHNYGTVFEIAKTSDGYASTPILLASFNIPDGIIPDGGLVADAAGDLFGTTQEGGKSNLGTVFEIKRTESGYASSPTVLANFNSTT